ncbi:hypothetical protein OG985_20430 [Streptomyces sp. NBC_00289]|uniref:hypothetical protein n=1 Tax=Streptomyces sp. NBC_00289 TaxID=2975703 RepID=UPI00324D1BD2
MTEGYVPFSERGLGYDVFAPLWGILELGAVTVSGARSLRDVSLAAFVATRRDEVDSLLTLVRVIGDFSAETMAVFERQGGWNDGREVTAEYVTLYSGSIEGYPPDTDNPAVLRRMLRMAGDLQLATLLHALVSTATLRGPGLKTAPELIVAAMRMAGSLLGVDDERVAWDAFRLWRVRFLPEILRPESPSREDAKVNLRRYAHALEDLLDPSTRSG